MSTSVVIQTIVASPEAPSRQVLVTDLILPDCRGDELAVALRRRWPELPVVIISGYSEDETAQTALQLDAAGFLYKPFTVEALAHKIRLALEHHPEIRLIVLGVVEALPRDGHQAFGDLATPAEVLSAPWIVNRTLPGM